MSLLWHHSRAHALLCDTTISTQLLLSKHESRVSAQMSKYSVMAVGRHCCQWATDAWLWHTCVCDTGVTSFFFCITPKFSHPIFSGSYLTTKKQIFTSSLSNEECVVYDRSGQTKASSFIVKLCCSRSSGPWWITPDSLQSYLFYFILFFTLSFSYTIYFF